MTDLQTIKQEITETAERCEQQAATYGRHLKAAQERVDELKTAVSHFEKRATEYRALLEKLD